MGGGFEGASAHSPMAQAFRPPSVTAVATAQVDLTAFPASIRAVLHSDVRAMVGVT